jgi:hypothetical protein
LIGPSEGICQQQGQTYFKGEKKMTMAKKPKHQENNQMKAVYFAFELHSSIEFALKLGRKNIYIHQTFPMRKPDYWLLSSRNLRIFKLKNT